MDQQLQFQYINDLACNNITIQQTQNVGSVYIDSIPRGATIYINNIEQIGLITPATINNIPSPSELIYRLVKPGYIAEGTLFIPTGQTYNVFVTLCQVPTNILPLLIGAAIVGILLIKKKEKEKT